LVVRGFISKSSEIPNAVPNLSFKFYNEKEEIIQVSSVKAPVGLLDQNGSAEY
jgi:hypothetical protein